MLEALAAKVSGLIFEVWLAFRKYSNAFLDHQ
jgi:hypothetical protein